MQKYPPIFRRLFVIYVLYQKSKIWHPFYLVWHLLIVDNRWICQTLVKYETVKSVAVAVRGETFKSHCFGPLRLSV